MVAAGRRGDSSHRSCSAVTLTWACASVLVTLSTLLLLLTFRPQDDASWLDTFGPSLAFIPGISLRAETRNHPHPPDLSNEQRPKEKFDAFRHDPSNTSNTIQKYAAVDAKGVLNIHVVPHTHDDVGWKKTVEQYFYGWNMSIDLRGHVQSIITTSLESVLQNPARTFTYVESKFFSMWWNLASDAQKQSMHYVIDGSKQWTFVNGGWSMHDEACTHYMGMIDQTTTGHSFLQRHLGVIPKVAWQLDPFGHSATQASLMTHKMGMNAIYFGRIDHEDLQLRQQEQRCEGLWNPTNPNNATIDPTVFFGLTGSYGGNYGPPSWDFMFDDLYVGEQGITPLTLLNETELYAKMENFLQLMAVQAQETRTNDVLLTMGSDFTYRKAESYFSNLDLLIHTVMLGQKWNLWNLTEIFQDQGISRVNVFYSNPNYYTERKYKQTQQFAAAAVKSETIPRDESETKTIPVKRSLRSPLTKQEAAAAWTTKTDDFFPYSDCPHCFWSGYFTSRTAFKRFERVASAFLQAARQLDLLMDSRAAASYTAESHPLFDLEDALGVAQHHDGITGTGKQHVADDYSLRLQAGINTAAAHVLGIILDQVFGGAKNEFTEATENTKAQALLKDSLTKTLQYCPLLHNETICEAASNTKFENNQEDMHVVIYNPLSKQSSTPRSWVVRVPVSQPGIYVVKSVSPSGSLKKHEQAIRARPVHRKNRNGRGAEQQKGALHVEFLAGPLLPLGAVTYRISLQTPLSQESIDTKAEEGLLLSNDLVEVGEDTVKVSNGRGMIVTFNRHSGDLKHILSGHERHEDAFLVDLPLVSQWGYYTPYNDAIDPSGTDGQNSGAYIFRPSTPNQELQVLPVCEANGSGAKFIPTSLGLEVHTSFGKDGNCWVHQIVRISKGQPWIEVEYTVGPVPIDDDGRGKEVVTRFLAPDIANDGQFYTDSNGRAFFKRTRDFRPSWDLSESYEPIAGNYYPVNAAIFIQDANASLALLTDRSRGGASILDGTLEVKVQRRTIADDHRGVDEPLNETIGGMTPYPPYGDATRIGGGVTVSGSHRIMVGPGNAGAKVARSVMDDIFAQPMIFVGSAPSLQNPECENSIDETLLPSFSVLNPKARLPPNVFLITLMRLYDYHDDGSGQSMLLVRLGHQYDIGEDDNVLSKPVQVNIQTLLDSRLCKVVSVTEKTLSGNQNWTDFVSTKFNWTDPIKSNNDSQGPTDDSGSIIVTLQPMDIRTFYVAVEKLST